MITPQIIPLFCAIGSDFDQTLTFVSTATKQPINLTGATAAMRIYTGQVDANGNPLSFLTLTTENGGITIDPTAGKLTFAIPRTVTATFPTSGLTIKTQDMGGNCGCTGEVTGYAANYSLEILMSNNSQQYASYFSPFMILPR